MTAGLASDAVVENPYKGLRAFHDGDSHEFFGRERLTAEMVQRMSGPSASSRCLVVVGPSGSGKSSVVRAGLVPALRAGAVEGSADWFGTTMLPGNDPYESLAAALLRIAVNPPASLVDVLRDGERGLLRGLRACLGSDTDKVLLIIDQFEELFTATSADDADRFLDALAGRGGGSPPRRCVSSPRCGPTTTTGRSSILRSPVCSATPRSTWHPSPATSSSRRSSNRPTASVSSFEPGLVPRIAADTLGQPSPLPLLQYMLSELFARRSGAQMTVSAYDDLGGLSGALTTQAERLYASAGDDERAAIRQAFGRLTNPGQQSADLRRRRPLADLGDDAATAWVLAEFGSARLLTFDRDDATREPTVEVAHEALLREWPRLVDWLREDQDLLRIADAVSSAATAWATGGREPSDLHRGSRLDAAMDLYVAAPERLRDLDVEFVNESRLAAEAERRTEQHRVRRLRRLVVGVGAALVVALVAGGFALRQQQRADDEARRAQEAAADAEEQAVLAEEQATIAEEQTAAAVAAAEDSEIATLVSRSAALSTEDPTLSILLALEAHRRRPGAETEQAVLNALGSGDLPSRIFSVQLIRQGGCDFPRISADRTVSFGMFDGVLRSGPNSEGEFTEHGEPPAPCVVWSGDEAVGRRWAQTPDDLRLWLGPFSEGSEDWDVELEFEVPTYVASDRMTPADRLVLAAPTGSETVVWLLDDRTGESPGSAVTGDGPLIEADVTPDGALVASSFDTPRRPQGGGQLFVLDGADGRPLFSLDLSIPLVAMTWDQSTTELIGVTPDGEVVTVDPALQQVVSTVQSTAASSILDVAVRPDGLITVVSRGQVEVIDRRSGPSGSPTTLRNAEGGWARPDGTVVTISSDNRIDVFEIDGNPLTESVIDVDPFSSFGFNEGLAGGLRVPFEPLEMVDLTTGERSMVRLVTSDGAPFEPVKWYPESDGSAWAVTSDSTVARFEGGTLVEQLDLGGFAVTGTRFGDRWAMLREQADGRVVDVLELEPGGPRVSLSVAVPGATTAHPTLDGGVHVVTDRAVLTYDDEGALVGEVSTTGGAFRERGLGVGLITLDPNTGTLALAGGPGGVLLVDPATGEIDSLPMSDAVANLGFARDGGLLVITSFDGTVRLWDVERNASAGVVWTGSGAVPGSPSWYDAETETVWVNTSGKLLQITVDPARLARTGVCERRAQHHPGGMGPLRSRRSAVVDHLPRPTHGHLRAERSPSGVQVGDASPEVLFERVRHDEAGRALVEIEVVVVGFQRLLVLLQLVEGLAVGPDPDDPRTVAALGGGEAHRCAGDLADRRRHLGRERHRLGHLLEHDVERG